MQTTKLPHAGHGEINFQKQSLPEGKNWTSATVLLPPKKYFPSYFYKLNHVSSASCFFKAP